MRARASSSSSARAATAAAPADRGSRVAFRTRGRRRRRGYGLYYAALCGRYWLYQSDQVAGVPVRPARWLAIAAAPHEHVIGRAWTRDGAERLCRAHAANEVRVVSRESRGRRVKQ